MATDLTKRDVLSQEILMYEQTQSNYSASSLTLPRFATSDVEKGEARQEKHSRPAMGRDPARSHVHNRSLRNRAIHRIRPWPDRKAPEEIVSLLNVELQEKSGTPGFGVSVSH